MASRMKYPWDSDEPTNSLRNEVTFPSIQRIVEDNNTDLTSVPKIDYHCAYIGTIDDIVVRDFLDSHRLVLLVKGRVKKEIKVAFYDRTRGLPLLSYIQIGYALVVLYPKPHQFIEDMGQPVGFKIEDEQMKNIRIIPHSYRKLLAANDRYFSLISKPPNCAGCNSDKEDTATKKLPRCPRCWVTKYCGKECQTEDWDKHKKECRPLKDVQWFTRKDWATVQDDAPGKLPVMFTGAD
ncbi:hypothetical protein BJ508DRAFT_325570 [Ascobolus immersus RN42]|uniref:MYND-type domain-containing protein n=1 Tax=Ascobolus immersus RN42 TaxID=1160509 RepID=A0A3N4IDL3_ASCIM|nr:hypothetical protein BJ508DRAFT_325570 [Ascobolus immersus RN42]